MNRAYEQEDVGKYYRLLGVKEGAPMESVRRGYHRMSKDHQYVF
jgi:DnaJ-class molecular chaperone